MFKQLLITAIVFAGGVASAPIRLMSHCRADQPWSEISREIEQARSALDPNRLPDLAEAEAAVLDAVADCQAYLQRRATDDNAAAWKRYLAWESLTEAIDQGASVAQRGHAAVELESRLRDIYPGLELKSMMSLRSAVQRYIAALRYSDPQRGIASVQRQLDALSEIVSAAAEDVSAAADEDVAGTPSPEKSGGFASERRPRALDALSADEVGQIEQLLGGLADANQAAPLISKIQSHFNHGNIRAWVDGDAIIDAIARPIHTPRPVDDCILGTRVIGQGRIDGNVTGRLLPSEGYVRLLIRMDGMFSTSARGYRKPITLDTTGRGRVYAARQIAVTEKGVVLGKTVSTADLSTQIHRINHPIRLVRRIARKQAAEQRPLAEAISREKLRGQVGREFDAQTAATAGRSFSGLDRIIDPWLSRLDFPSLSRTIGSTSDTVYARANLQRRYGLAAPNDPPPLALLGTGDGPGVLPGNYLVAVQVHQSLVDNTIAPLLAGQTFTPDRIVQLAETLDWELPNRDAIADSTGGAVRPGAGIDQAGDDPDQESEDYEVDLANFRPVFIEVGDQELRVGLRGTRFSQAGRELQRSLEVSATYRPLRGEDGAIWLRRDDDVRLSFPGNRRLSISQTAIKTNMQKSFNELFPIDLLHRPISIPDTAQVRALAGRELQISAIDLRDGWISIAVR